MQENNNEIYKYLLIEVDKFIKKKMRYLNG